MNRLQYYKLRCLPENKDLTEFEFQMKYDKKKDGEYNLRQTNTIPDLEAFKEKINSMKSTVEKKIIEW